jgi:hypothetical protein
MSKVTVKMVKSFDGGRECLESYPCRHRCQIVLSDGRSRNVSMSGFEVHALIKSLSKEKIIGHFGKKHFDGQPLFERIFCCAEPMYERKPNAILTKAFGEDDPVAKRHAE